MSGSNPFLLAPQDRVFAWRDLRRSLQNDDEPTRLQRVAKWWAKAPLTTIAYDAEDLRTWPTIWEMITIGEWCQNSVAVGMEATLRLSGWEPERLELRHIRDLDEQIIRLILVVDGKTVLNYDHGNAIPLPETRQIIMARWQFKTKIYEPIGL